MEREEWLALAPYGLDRGQKRALYRSWMARLTAHHRQCCPEYRRLLDALGCPEDALLEPEELPMLPVSLFKQRRLCSVPAGEGFKTLTSSGTTGQQVSRICLDARTSADQQAVLYRIMADRIGRQRLPLLVLDSKKVLRDRAMFSARGAGILGFSIFGSRCCYALDDEMRLDLAAVREFAQKYAGRPMLLYGFTYIVWKQVLQALAQRGERLSIREGVLIHGGGWKKLENQAVGPAEFKAQAARWLGVRQVYDYYGMAEQTGCIYLECPCGHLHASVWSDVLLRRPADYGLCAPGEPGLIQVLSLLPWSYPGHSLLTEDMGVLLGEDDCPCGRKGKYFAVTGRVPQAEVRGCSDTYEG